MEYLVTHLELVGTLLAEHLRMAGLSLAISLLIAVPLGVLIARLRWLRGPVLGVLGVIYTIPSLSLFVLLIPLFGLGLTPAVIALVAYAQLVLVRNWLVGLVSIDPAMIEAGKAMGMNSWQLFWKVEFPLALPLLLAGIRLAAIAIIGIGTIAAYINAGGLGRLLFEGVTTANSQKILAGSLAVSVLAIAVNYLLRLLERRAEVAVRVSTN
ncbi:MAG TPA: ABC transporter permease [Anaerolineaceae bacterium]|nr:ABC transporter permease [Anaerolineaceae bacterium]